MIRGIFKGVSVARLAALLGVCLPVLAGCQSVGSASNERFNDGIIEGGVVYRERMLLLPGSKITVRLQEAGRADAGAEPLATLEFPADGGPPFLFELKYDPDAIDARGRYTLHATVSGRDGLMFESTEEVNPFATSPVEVLVRRAAP